MNEIISPITAAAVGSGGRTSDDGVVGSLIDHFESAIWAERNFYAILLGVWLAFALIGIIVMIWHSGGRDRYVARRGTLITADSAAESKFWPWKKERPLYNEYTEKQFRGTTPTVPRIVEPDQNGNSFFDTGTSRPFVPRKSTFGSTISSLAAPGQAFLRMAGRPTPTPTPTPTLTPTPTPTPDHGRANLVEKGASSEQYNSGVPIDELETPPPFWVNKFFRAVGSARDLLPTRGQRHGAALGRDGSQRTERSFRASFTTPGRDWAGEREGEPAWTMVDPQSIGRALDGINDGPVDSRYPPLPRSYPSTSQPIFLVRCLVRRHFTRGTGSLVAKCELPLRPTSTTRSITSTTRVISIEPTQMSGTTTCDPLLRARWPKHTWRMSIGHTLVLRRWLLSWRTCRRSGGR